MEVHHHPDVEKKGFKEYFLEFLMIFLAVTMGFIAENIREYFGEKQHAKVFAGNLYNELKNDTSSLNWLIAENKLTAEKLDTFCFLVKEKNKLLITSGMLYYYGAAATTAVYFSPHNATYEEMKSSGNLRIMGNDIANKLSEYDNDNMILGKEYDLDKAEVGKIEDLHFKIFDGYNLEKILPMSFDYKSSRDSIFKIKNLFITTNRELMNEYTGKLEFEATIYRHQIKDFLEPIKNSAEDLLDLLRKKYHFD